MVQMQYGMVWYGIDRQIQYSIVQFIQIDRCVYGQGLFIKRLCSDSKDCETHLKNLKKLFHDRGYPENIDNRLKRVKIQSREELLRPKERGNKSNDIPFIVTYHPHLKHMSKLIKYNSKHFCANVKVKSVFTPATFASFRTAHNLRSHL